MNKFDFSFSNILKPKEFAIFCGAGISKNSGIPLANEIKKAILEIMHMKSNEIDELMKSSLPFEAFMESFSENFNISKLLDVFKNGEPNTNHIFLARLARKGLLKTIFTTNFDLLIEKALIKEGMKENIDYIRFYDEEHFDEKEFNKIEEKVALFKIHGSIDDMNSIRTTLKAVANKDLSNKRLHAIKRLFSAGEHKRVLILGYSCSDIFDLTPNIMSIEKGRKKIVFVEHINEKTMEIEDIKKRRYKNPFTIFSGKRIICNADKLIENAWDSCRATVGEYIHASSKTAWETNIAEWNEELTREKPYIKSFIAGRLFADISDCKRAIKYFNQSLSIAKETKDKTGEKQCYSSLGFMYQRLGKYNKTIEFHEKSLKISRIILDKPGVLGSCLGLGSANYRLGYFKKAREYYEESLRISREIKYKTGEASSNNNLGYVYTMLGDCIKAIKCHENSIARDRDLGDLKGEARSFIGMGNAYHTLGKFIKAGELYESALNIAKGTGERALESSCYMGLGSVYLNIGNIKYSVDYSKKALSIAIEIGDKAIEAGCLINLGSAYRDRGNYKKAIEHYKKALILKKKIGDRTGIMACYIGFGDTLVDLGKLKSAIKYYEESLKITEEIEYKEAKLMNKKGLGDAYNKLGNVSKAIDCYEEGLKIAGEIKNKAWEARCNAGLGNTYANMGMGNFKRALDYYLKARKIFIGTRQMQHLAALSDKILFVTKRIGKNRIIKNRDRGML